MTTPPIWPEWRPISEAPRDGSRFLALNHDREVWVAKYIDGDRLAFRYNRRREPRKFEVREMDGERWLKEDTDFAKREECWSSDWCFWTRMYEFEPTHFLPLPPSPKD